MLVLELFIAEDVDLANLGFRPFSDFEDDIDPVLIEHHHLWLNSRAVTALAAIKIDDPRHVSAGFGPGENLPRGKLDFRADLVFLDPLIAFQQNAVDDRVFADFNDEIALIIADLHVGKQFGFDRDRGSRDRAFRLYSFVPARSLM